MTIYKLRTFLVGLTRLGREMRSFAEWLEGRVMPGPRKSGVLTVAFKVADDDGVVYANPNETPDLSDPPDAWPLVGRLLRKAGALRIEMSTRLESNQISDVLMLLALRRGLDYAHGVQHACAMTTVADGLLSIEYSYCVTKFSRVVHWYKARQKKFSDHRAMFHAAPRYTLLAAALAMTPPIVYAIANSWTVLVVLTVMSVAAISTLIYSFFMTVGSVEYDNEEKAHRLRVANAGLENYAARIGADLQLARNIQQMLLPDAENMPLADRLNWASSFVPETAVGGDYFDAAALDDDRVAIIFTDVSGHGMSAAFVTAIVKTAFHRWVDDGGRGIEQFTSQLNSSLYRMTPDESFAASFIAVYDSSAGRIDYINCGHSPEPWLVPADGGRAVEPLNDARAVLLGVLDELTPTAISKSMSPGDKLVFATDGLPEAVDLDGQQYGLGPLAELVSDCRQSPAEQVVVRIVRTVGEFSRGAVQLDDQTVLVMEVRSPPRPPN